MFVRRVFIRSFEVGLLFRDGEFRGLLAQGRHWLFGRKISVDVVSQRAPWLTHEKLDVIVKSGALDGRAIVVDLKDYLRGLVCCRRGSLRIGRSFATCVSRSSMRGVCGSSMRICRRS